MEGLSREEAGEWIRFVEKDQFSAALAQALNGKTTSKIDIACVEAARGFSWTSQFNRLKGHLEELKAVNKQRIRLLMSDDSLNIDRTYRKTNEVS